MADSAANRRDARDLVLAAGFAAAAPLSIAAADASARWSPAVVAVAALHVVAAGLVLVRRAVRETGPAWTWLAALPSFAAGAWALRAAAAHSDWTPPAIAILAASVAVTVASLVTLGRSFAVFPALRPLVSSGPYRVVRNPALAGEIGIVAACTVASGSWLPFALCVPTAALRVIAEERVLAAAPGWGAYAARTRWRLVPCVW